MKVVCYSTNPEIYEFGRAELNNLLETSDIVLVSAKFEPNNSVVIGPENIGLLPVGCHIVNTACSVLVDDFSIFKAVETGQLVGYASDVLDKTHFGYAKKLI